MDALAALGDEVPPGLADLVRQFVSDDNHGDPELFQRLLLELSRSMAGEAEGGRRPPGR